MTSQVPPAAPSGESGDEASRQALSALLDGQAPAGDAQAVQRACALWRESGQARQDWHTWHLIGDVMRSEELARPPARDAAFLARLRERLADEPVVLAPLPVPPSVPVRVAPAAPAAARVGRPAWLLPTAVAASFVAVAGVLVVARMAPPSPGPVLATAPALGVVAVPGATPSSTPGGSVLIRNPRLDSYLRAHQTARGSVAAAVPGGGMRNVEATLGPGAGR